MTHYKTEGTYGAQHISLEKELIEPFIMQHMAHKAYAKEGELIIYFIEGNLAL